jgi:CIC family chloride channel protein
MCRPQRGVFAVVNRGLPGSAFMSNTLLKAAGFFRRLPDNTRTILVTSILSLAAAGLAVAFLFLTNTLFSATYGWFARQSKVFFLVASFITITTTSLVVGLLLNRLSPDAAGSGIPQLKAAYWKDLGHVPIRPVIVKFVAGVLSIGGGTSLGREGPTVFMGGGLSSWLSGFMGSSKRERRNPSLIGASAGLAAAFNTPLAAMTFVLEEIVGDISSRSIGRVLLSSVIGAFTVYALIGRQPSFQVPSLDQVSWIHYAIAPVVALAAALLGIVFHRQTLAWRRRIKSQTRLPKWLLPVIGGLITWCIGATVFIATGKLGVFGLGYQDLSSVLKNDYLWWIAGVMVIGKLLATIASYSFGGCGGIFSPLLFIGGLSGYFIGSVFSLWLPLTPSDLIVLSAVGMSTCLGTVVKAPLSALLIVFEMTHQFAMVPALLIGMFVSMAVSRLSGSANFYDAILVQDGNELHKIRPPLDLTGWQKLPVSAIATRNPVVITSIDRKSLTAAIDRYPYACFPLVLDGKLQGVLSREAILEALSARAEPEALPAVVCGPDQPVHEAAERFICSTLGFIVIVDDSTGKVSGILTLHDVLRAQAAVTE